MLWKTQWRNSPTAVDLRVFFFFFFFLTSLRQTAGSSHSLEHNHLGAIVLPLDSSVAL